MKQNVISEAARYLKSGLNESSETHVNVADSILARYSGLAAFKDETGLSDAEFKKLKELNDTLGKNAEFFVISEYEPDYGPTTGNYHVYNGYANGQVSGDLDGPAIIATTNKIKSDSKPGITGGTVGKYVGNMSAKELSKYIIDQQDED